jgi:uncharacterized protein with HEPN domain
MQHRDITAHRYQTLRMEDVYMTATQDFTKLRSQLETILKETETEENHVKE